MMLQQILTLGAVLFTAGVFTILTRRNAIAILMGVELILNSVNINFVAFDRFCHHDGLGNLAATFNIAIAALEVSVALAIVIGLYRSARSVDVDSANQLKG